MKNILYLFISIHLLYGKVLVNDFLVNGYGNDSAREEIMGVFTDEDYNSYIVWRDERYGMFSNIFLREVSRGEIRGEERRVNPYTFNILSSISTFPYSDSGFAVVWYESSRGKEERDGGYYFCLMDSRGNKRSRDVKLESYSSHFDMDNGWNLHFLDLKYGTWKYWRIDSTGNFVGDIMKLEGLSGSLQDVKVNDWFNIFIVTRENSDGYFFYLIFTTFDTTGNILNKDSIRFEKRIDSVEYINIVKIDNHEFFVIWKRYNGSYQRYYIEGIKFDENGKRDGNLFKIVETEEDFWLKGASINRTGKGVVFYTKDGITCATFDVERESSFAAFPVIETCSYSPFAVWIDHEDFYIIWSQWPRWNIHMKRYDIHGDSTGDTLFLNSDIGSTFEYEPSVCMDGDGNFAVAWRNLDQYFINFYNSDGILLSGDTLLAHGTFGGGMSIDCNKNGDLVLLWKDVDLYVKIYAINGEQRSGPIMVNKPYRGSYFGSVKVFENGDFVVSWLDRSFPAPPIIKVQRFDSTGKKIGEEINGSSYLEDEIDVKPSIVLKKGGKFDIIYDYGGMFVTSFDSTGNILRKDYPISNLPNRRSEFTAETDGDNVYLGYFTGEGDTNRVYIAKFDENYNLLWQKFIKSATPIGDYRYGYYDYPGTPGVALTINREEDFLVAGWCEWEFNRSPQFVAQKFNLLDGKHITDIQTINDSNYFRINAHAPTIHSIASCGEKIIYAWADNRNAMGWDVYAKVTDWDLIYGVQENHNKRLPALSSIFVKDRVEISQNKNSEYTLYIYEPTGRKVREERLTKSYIDIKHLSKGVYFIIIKDREHNVVMKSKIIKTE